MDDEVDDLSGMEDTMAEAYDEATDESPDQPRDEGGRFSSQDDEPAPEDGDDSEIPAEEAEDPDADNSDEVAEDTEGEEVTLEPPGSWTSEAKTMFSEASPELQKYILQRDQEQQEGFVKATEQYEEKSSIADQFIETVRPYEAQMRAEGATPLQAVQTLLNTAHILRTGTQEQKAQIIRQTAQQFGVGLDNEPGELNEFTDPNVTALQKQVADLTQIINNQQATTAAEAQRGVDSEVTSFADELDKDGNPLRPHFEAVAGELAPIITAIREANPGKSHKEVLDEAYDRAVWANPETRKAEQERIAKAEEAKRLADAKKAATDAKKGKNVSTKGTRPAGKPKSSANPKDWDDDLAEVYDKAS